MKTVSFLYVIVAALLIMSFGCSAPASLTDADRFNGVIERVCNPAFDVVSEDFDDVLAPTNIDRYLGDFDYTTLGKYVLGDYYTNDISDICVNPTTDVSGVADINDWGEEVWARDDGETEEPYWHVMGDRNDEVKAIMKIADSDVNVDYRGLYHVYLYVPWEASGSYSLISPWFGNGHVLYLNPVDGGVAPGEPYLELFPETTGSNVVGEARFEKTSYFHYLGIHGGGSGDPGSTPEEAMAILGINPTVVDLTDREDVDYSMRNIFYTYPLDDTYEGAYIHFEDDVVSCRVFLADFTGVMRIGSLYFQSM